MEYQLEITYSDQIIKRAAKCFWSKRFGSDYYTSSFVLLISIIYLFIFKTVNWLGAVIFTVVCIYFLTVFGGLIYYQNSALRNFKAFTNNTVKWSFNEVGISTESSLGNSQINWHAIPKYHLTQDFLLLIFNNNAYSTLPISQINNELIEFITGNIKKAGGHAM